MTADDLTTAFLSEIAIGEATAIVSEVERMANLPFAHGEWVNLDQLDDSLQGEISDELPHLPYKHLGYLPGQLQDLHHPVTAKAALSRLLGVSAASSSQVEFQHVEFRSELEGMTVEIKYQDRMTPTAARNAYIRASGDRSDSLRFPRNRPENPELWEFTLCFSQQGMQRSRKKQAIGLPGETIMRITRDALRE